MDSAKILVIEDNPDIARAVAYCLRQEGHQVTVVADGEEGLEEAIAGEPDLIVLDLMLPSLEGEEICRRIRAHSSPAVQKIPILILSAKGSENERIIGKISGGSAYLTKPFEMEDLLDGVKWFLEKARNGKS